jgi:Domain of unknown function (DUF4917)
MISATTAHRVYSSIDDRLLDWKDIESDFSNGGILLGNGFSQAVWEKFGYSSIYKAACSEQHTRQPLTPEDIKLFEAKETTNFEMILAGLSEAANVNQIFKKEYQFLNERYEHIKSALGEAIRSVHVPWDKVTDNVLSEIKDAISKYKFVFTTNYDLLPYWAIMSGNGPKDFLDFFWSKDDLSGARDFFDIANSGVLYPKKTQILYLHGALHLYKDSKTKRTHKMTNGHSKSNLLEISKVPLFITEGSSSDKLAAIRDSDYLLFAYGQLLSYSKPLVVFGHSLGPTDQHLIDALKKDNRNKIAISIRGSNSCEKIMKQKADLMHLFSPTPNSHHTKPGPELIFFDASTHPLGGENIRISP